MNFGEWLKAKREETTIEHEAKLRGITIVKKKGKCTQRDVQAITGINYTNLAHLEAGRKKALNFTSMIKIADLYGLSMDEIVRKWKETFAKELL